MILVIKTDSPETYIALFKDKDELVSKVWAAGRELSVQINGAISELCEQQTTEVSNIKGIIFYKGPGSYTGLRIGASVTNAIGYSNKCPVVAASGGSWIQAGMKQLKTQVDYEPVAVDYGGEVFTTKPRK